MWKRLNVLFQRVNAWVFCVSAINVSAENASFTIGKNENRNLSSVSYNTSLYSVNEINEFAADVNEDNSVDLKDLLMITRDLAGYDITFGG